MFLRNLRLSLRYGKSLRGTGAATTRTTMLENQRRQIHEKQDEEGQASKQPLSSCNSKKSTTSHDLASRFNEAIRENVKNILRMEPSPQLFRVDVSLDVTICL